jgi:hypothetical protein
MKTDSKNPIHTDPQPGGEHATGGTTRSNHIGGEEKKDKANMKKTHSDIDEAKDMEKKEQEAKRLEEKKDAGHAEATRFVDALAAVEGEIAAISEGELATINLDIGIATVTVLGCMPELRSLRAALVAKFDEETGSLVEKLDLRARAASQANVDYYGTVQNTDAVTEASKRALEARAMLLVITQLLVQRKVLGAGALENLRGTVGFRNQVHDLQHLVSVLRRAPAAARDVVSISLAELDVAEDAAKELVTAIGVREQAPPVLTAAAEKRQRAFTLFIRTYEQLRAAINHLRWREKDVESILPSLYAGRGGRKKEEPTDVIVAPVVNDEVVTPTPLVASPVDVPENKPAPVKPGLPGADPFAPV